MSQTVLVADDSQTIRKVVQMALKASEFEVVGVGSAREAVQAAKQQPSVILLDYYMPDGSGYDVCRAIKQDSATHNIPVVMLGGTYKDFDPDKARQSGAVDVVMKPFKTDELIGAVKSAANGAAAAAPPPQRPQQRQPQQRQPQQPQRGGSAPGVQPPSRANPAQTPLPESQPRISVDSGPQSRTPSAPGSQGGSQPGVSTSRQRQPTPPPGTGSGASQMPMGREELQEFIRAEIQKSVREELPGLLRNVMGEIFQKKVLPKLIQHTENKIQEKLDGQLQQQITHHVRLELERLLEE